MVKKEHTIEMKENNLTANMSLRMYIRRNKNVTSCLKYQISDV